MGVPSPLGARAPLWSILKRKDENNYFINKKIFSGKSCLEKDHYCGQERTIQKFYQNNNFC